MRVDRAQRLLETTRLPMHRVAEESGFGSYPSMRVHFKRVVGIPPQQYRQAYRAKVDG
ncbi:MAG: helix-turn-helix domain-containing protein [Gordonia amarae]